MERVLKNIEKKIRYIKKTFKVNEVLSTQIYLYNYIFFYTIYRVKFTILFTLNYLYSYEIEKCKNNEL